MKTPILIVFFYFALNLIQPLNAFAEKNIIYKTSQQTDAEFEAQKIARTDAVGYDEYAAENLAPHTLKENLTKAFLEAQNHFLKSELTVIKNHWEEVVSFAYKADWGPVHREMILIAYLRLAHMAQDAESTRSYLVQASQYDADFMPDKKLFPPPLIEQYLSVKSQTEKIQLDFKNADGFTYVMINGQKYKLHSRNQILIAPGTKRITFLSPSYEPVTRVLDALALSTYKPEKQLLTQQIKKNNQTVAPVAGLGRSDYPAPSIENKSPINNHLNFFKKPNFWIGATILAGAVLAIKHQSSSNSGEPTPTHREGL